jgi:hypothetical protein
MGEVNTRFALTGGPFAMAETSHFQRISRGTPDAQLVPRFRLMKSKIITAIGATSLVFGMFALQGCFESNYPDYGGYGYGSGYYSQPVVVEQRPWHWWGHQDRDNDHRYESHHSEHEEHATRDRDHDHDHD